MCAIRIQELNYGGVRITWAWSGRYVTLDVAVSHTPQRGHDQGALVRSTLMWLFIRTFCPSSPLATLVRFHPLYAADLVDHRKVDHGSEARGEGSWSTTVVLSP